MGTLEYNIKVWVEVVVDQGVERGEGGERGE
jgi:hypothetical protein